MASEQGGGGNQAGMLLVGFVIGALTGAVVALLLAPAPGDQTRRYLGDKAREGRERAGDVARQSREFINRQRESVASVVDRSRDTLTTAVEKGREAYRQARDKENA